ncbi:MAG: hypothetical protein ACJ8J0_27065 [Longimicrobiaceae bacterium]
MIGELLGEVVGWVASEIVGEVFGEAVGGIFPKRVSGWVVLACCAVTSAVLWASTRWWQADSASNARTSLVVLAWILLPVFTIMLALQYDAGVQERRRLRRESAGLGALRNDRLRAR